MTTELKRFTEAYATMTVAAYEPLILRWVSLLGIRFIANTAVSRLPKAASVNFDGTTPVALALGRTLRKSVPPSTVDFRSDQIGMTVPADLHGRPLNADAFKKLDIPGYPNAVAVGQDVYLNGFSGTEPLRDGRTSSSASERLGSSMQGVKTIPIAVSSRLGVSQPDFDFLTTRHRRNFVRHLVEVLLFDGVPYLDRAETEEALNARRILCLFGADAATHVLDALQAVGAEGRKQGMEVLWALLVSEDVPTRSRTLREIGPKLAFLLADKRRLPDHMPDHIERDFKGRICDLTYILFQLLNDPAFDQSLFRSFDDDDRDREIERFNRTMSRPPIA